MKYLKPMFVIMSAFLAAFSFYFVNINQPLNGIFFMSAAIFFRIVSKDF